MSKSEYREGYAHVDEQQDREIRDADAYYSITVFEDSKQYVTTQANGRPTCEFVEYELCRINWGK